MPPKLVSQMRAGLIPSPYEDNDLAAYYFLDEFDISGNQEKVFNQVTASWDALYLAIPSSIKTNKFVDAAVTTRQRFE